MSTTLFSTTLDNRNKQFDGSTITQDIAYIPCNITNLQTNNIHILFTKSSRRNDQIYNSTNIYQFLRDGKPDKVQRNIIT